MIQMFQKLNSKKKIWKKKLSKLIFNKILNNNEIKYIFLATPPKN